MTMQHHFKDIDLFFYCSNVFGRLTYAASLNLAIKFSVILVHFSLLLIFTYDDKPIGVLYAFLLNFYL